MHTKLATICVFGIGGLLLAACGETSTPSGGTSASAGTTSPPTSAPSSTAVSPLAAWCTLTIGESEADVNAAMGPTHGNKADYFKVAGIVSEEWDEGNDILLASFVGGVATNLQAYAGAIGPIGASDITCAAFRH